MLFSDSILGEIYKQTNVPILVSKLDTFEVCTMNDSAEQKFGVPDKTYKSYQILKLNESLLEWYHKLPKQLNAYGFVPLRDPETGERCILDSYIVAENGQLYRVDVLEPEGNQDRMSYYCKLEICSDDQRWNAFSEKNAGENIQHILQAALFIYGADRVYIVEIDPDIQCLADLYTLARWGFDDDIASVRSIGKDGVETFLSAWNTGEAFSNSDYRKENYTEWKLYAQLYQKIDVWSYMVVPFRKSSGIRCFLCVDNVRRFFGNEGIMRYFCQLLTNCMYVNRLRTSMDSAQNLLSKLRHIPENQVRIELFGGLKVSTTISEFQDVSALSSQCGTFFVYLLSNRHRIVPARELAEILWPNELIDNPYAMIKNVAFRTRKVFETICTKPMIVAGSGTYSINRDLDIWLDIEEFEEQCRLAKRENLPEKDQLESCKRAFEIYQGGMLPNFEAETWLMTRICYYQLLYLDSVRIYLNLLNAHNDFLTMFQVAAKVMEQEKLDSDLHLVLLDALLRNGKKELARSYYSKIKTELLPEEDAQFRSYWAKYT